MRLLLIASALVSLAAYAAPADRSDHAIAEEIRARFAKSKVAANHFEVRVQNGVATLTGKAEVVQHKGAATRMAKTGGATKVINNIEVSPQAREKASARLAAARQAAKAQPKETPAKQSASSSQDTPAVPPPGPGDVPPPVRRARVKH